MAKKDKNLTVALIENYSFEMLLNDIQENVLENDDDAQDGNKAEREQKSKLIVLQMLIVKAHEYNDDMHHDDEKLRSAIDIMVNGDANLSGYIFFVSQNPQFDYSWNYLRKLGNNYKEFLVEGIRFLDNVLEDINMFARMPLTNKDVRIVINDILEVSMIGEKPFVKTAVLWKNFHRLADIKRNYNLTVKSKECILLAGLRKSASDSERLIKTAFEMLKIMKGSAI